MAEEKKEEISSADRVWSVVAYVWVFAFIPFILRRRPFVLYHAKQGVVLFTMEIILLLILPIPILGWIVGPLGLLLCTIFAFRGIFAALTGKKWKMPWLGRYTEKIRI